MTIRAPTLPETFEAVRLLDAAMRGVDAAYDALMYPRLRGWLARYIGLPLYFHWLNEGWILERDDSIAGWLYLQHFSHSTHVNDIGVAPAHQREGCGTRLLQWAEARAREKGKMVLTLAVSVTNHPAVRLYERNAFRPVHHTLWEGSRESLPIVPSAVRPRELEVPQRLAPFTEFWGHSLAADGHPTAPLLADQLTYWYTPHGRAWELWQHQRLVGYADSVGSVLRLFVGSPRNAPLLQAAWSALRPLLPLGRLTLDLGSAAAHEAARPILHAAGWNPTCRDRMLMVKPILA
jgi:GNAT superfamily N-acetyltransferase